MEKQKSFTLVELLVVIAVIGMLSSVILVSLGPTRWKARDSRRFSDLKQLQLAVELYYDENNSYPSTGGSWWGEGNPCYGDHDYSGPNGWIPNLAPEFIGKLPGDPKPNLAANHCYLYISDGTDYMIITHFTMEAICDGVDADTTPDPGDECNPSHIQQMDRAWYEQPTIAFYSPGAISW